MKEKERILIVSHSNEKRAALKQVLSDKYHVVEKEGAKQAFSLLSQEPEAYHMVIADYEMPEIGGIALLKEIKANSLLAGLPVLIITDLDYKKEEQESLLNGAAEVLRTPFCAEVLENRIEHIMKIANLPHYKNVMVDIIEQELDECIRTMGLCKCKRCREDLMALTLNRVKPKYVSSEKGAVLSKIGNLSYDYKVEIISAIASAANIIKEKPRHNLK